MPGSRKLTVSRSRWKQFPPDRTFAVHEETSALIAAEKLERLPFNREIPDLQFGANALLPHRASDQISQAQMTDTSHPPLARVVIHGNHLIRLILMANRLPTPTWQAVIMLAPRASRLSNREVGAFAAAELRGPESDV
jgi:hypothetical protein